MASWMLMVLLGCATSDGGEPPVPQPEPAPAPAAPGEPVRPTRVDLVLNRPVEVPELGATVTLLDAEELLVKDPSTGKRYHQMKGTLRFIVGDEQEDVPFGPSSGLEWRGRSLTIRGGRGGLELIVAPAR